MDNTVGKNIKHYRKSNHLTQAELAEKVSLTTAYLGRVEIGADFPSAETLKLIAYALKIPVDYLIRDDFCDPFVYQNSPVVKELETLSDDQLKAVMEAVKSIYERKQVDAVTNTDKTE